MDPIYAARGTRRHIGDHPWSNARAGLFGAVVPPACRVLVWGAHGGAQVRAAPVRGAEAGVGAQVQIVPAQLWDQPLLLWRFRTFESKSLAYAPSNIPLSLGVPSDDEDFDSDDDMPAVRGASQRMRTKLE